MSDASAMPASLAARDVIRELVARYAHAADRGRFDDVAALFAENGTLELPDGRVLTGRTAVRDFLTGTGDALRAPGGAGRVLRHHVSSHSIELDGDAAASGRAYFLVVTADGPDHWGCYSDRYVRVGDVWLFASRRVRVDGRAATSITTSLPRR
jgi:hypothetical protein